MSKNRLIITAVVLEGRPITDVAADYGVTKSWVSKLVARYRTEGDQAFQPRSRRPNTTPTALDPTVVDLILTLRDNLTTQGLDAGPTTIAWHLQHHHNTTVSTATIWRHLRAHDRVTPEPRKKPKSAYIRFEADQPNETWQSDFTHYPLADGTDTEIITWLDDHSRYALHISAHQRITGPIVIATFTQTCEKQGIPASTLTDNGMVYTARFARGGNSGLNQFETLLRQLGVTQKNSTPNHPTTCGKVERFQQTLKRWLRSQPPPATIADLQHLCDTFRELYNTQRPHRSLQHQATPAAVYNNRPKATPTPEPGDPETRIRYDRVDHSGILTLRYNGRLHHIGIGRTHARTPIVMLINGLDIRVINTSTGELLRHLTLDPTTDYQPQHPKRRNP